MKNRLYLHGALLLGLVMLSCMSTVTTVHSAEPDPYERLYDTIMLRKTGKIMSFPTTKETYGSDASAPLIWGSSRYLLEGERHDQFLTALDDFAKLSDKEMNRYTPEQRAILQRHLWVLFDWAVNYKNEPKDDESLPKRLDPIRKKVADLIRRIALSTEEIKRLPDTVAATSSQTKYPESADSEDPFRPFFPAELFGTDSPWVCLDKTYHVLVAPVHTKDEDSRSAFHIFMRLPGNRDDTLAYLKELGDFRDQWTTEKPDDRTIRYTLPHGGIHLIDIYVNPETPQFPPSTQFALVEQALLINNEGDIVGSPIVNAVQLREYLRVDMEWKKGQPFQALAQFVLNPRDLFEGDASLKPLGPEDRHLRNLITTYDPFEQSFGNKHGHGPSLKSCMGCHDGWGIHSVISRSQLFQLHHTLLPPHFEPGDRESNVYLTIGQKTNDVSWGYLRGLWSADQ